MIAIALPCPAVAAAAAQRARAAVFSCVDSKGRTRGHLFRFVVREHSRSRLRRNVRAPTRPDAAEGIIFGCIKSHPQRDSTNCEGEGGLRTILI